MKGQTLKDALKSSFVLAVILLCALAGYMIYSQIMGNSVNFEGGNNAGHPLPGNYLGIIYKGGFIVPVLIAINLILLTFIVERMISLSAASGKGNLNAFVRSLQTLLNDNKIEDASQLCDKQRGSLANVMKAGLSRYRILQADKTLMNDQKVLALQKDLEEATALELPVLSQNLIIMSTIASISVLVGLIGTVLGMIRAFGALATAGAPDSLALANGISEALVNTAFGITGSTIAIIAYNYFSARIDTTTYKMDEASFSLSSTFASTLK
ncbi:MAG TPA: MotA/TolQ/ExbB proton channel family protein [Prolixibacteraceae bacterium]|nr:MotA/TolQ/ExbB proton channel family protein [Prolixibacteraceae bacterium]